MTFIEASDVCQKMSMSLAMSTDSQENEDLMKSAGYSLGSPSLESKMFEEENTWVSLLNVGILSYDWLPKSVVVVAEFLKS